MMNPNRSMPVDGETDAGRLWLKLVGLFALSFVGFFILFFAYDVLTSFGQDRSAEPAVNERATPIVIDPKIETELAKVLSAEPTADAVDVKDPFVDRAGLSGAVFASASGSLQAAAATPGSTVQAATAGGSAVSGKPGTSGSAAPVVSAVEATKLRYASWVERSRINGDTPLDPRIFAIEDLLPVGIVDGGNGQQEVMFFSEAAGKTVSFPLGTLFFDGWLAELRPEGVVFGSTDDRRTVRMRSWARSFKNAG